MSLLEDREETPESDWRPSGRKLFVSLLQPMVELDPEDPDVLRTLSKARIRQLGMTVIELLMIMALISIIASMAVPRYISSMERSSRDRAILDITMIQTDLRAHFRDSGGYPTTLADMPGIRPVDPWGNPYQYLPLVDLEGKGKARKDRFLVPLNTDFDLYSMGPDGKSSSPLTAQASRDDIVRANNGAFIGAAADF